MTSRETLTESVLPTLRTGLLTAREKGGELMASDAAQEARRRGMAMVKAARGEPVVAVAPGRRRLRILGLVGLGAAIGAGAAWLVRRFPPAPTYAVPPIAEGQPTLTREDITVDLLP